jgi:hypothetical protein
MQKITWVKQKLYVSDIRELYTNLITGDTVEKTYRGQYYGNLYPSIHKRLCEEPTENVFQITEFDGWDFYAGGVDLQDKDIIGSYCCDGDGIIAVHLLTDGTNSLHIQGDYLKDLSSNIEQAIQEATDYIKAEYPAIYEEFLNF